MSEHEAGSAPDDDQPAGASGWYVAADGWVSVPGPDERTALRVRIQPAAGGRFVITDMLLSGRKLTADLLRQVQLSRIEAIFNLYADTLEAQTGSYVTAADGELDKLLAVDALKTGRPDDDLTVGELRRRTPRVLPAEQRTPLTRPDGSDPDGYYRRVAAAYRSAATQSSRPAMVLAAEAGVPVTSVHRWVREARRRGFLPPAEKGKAG